MAQRGIKVHWTQFPAGPLLLEGVNVGSIDIELALHRSATAISRPLFGGSSSSSARSRWEAHDVYLTWVELPREVAPKIAKVRKSAAFHGRIVRFGIRLHIIVRETANDAWTASRRIDSVCDRRTRFLRSENICLDLILPDNNECRVCTTEKEKTGDQS